MKRPATTKPPSRIGDLSDLPEAIRKTLLGGPELNGQIIEVIRHLNGSANVDEIIVFLYRRHGVMTTNRRELSNRIYRMTKANQLVGIKGRRGVFGLSSAEILRERPKCD